eukprot:404753-Prymnesium_polylepis.1
MPRAISLDASALVAPVLVFGRSESCDLQLDSMQYPGMLSRQHSRLTYTGAAGIGGMWQVEDLSSQNGTAVNGRKLRKKAPVATLADGDVVCFGVCKGERVSDACYTVSLGL